MDAATAPNHHAHHPGFAGASGLLAALTFTVGRKPTAVLAAELVDLSPTDTLVDVGCGPGVAARHAVSLGARVVGIDPAPVMLRVGRLLSRRRPVRYVEGTAESLPVDDASATVVWSLSTVHHWHDVDAGLREAHRVLRPGGRLLAIEKLARPGATGIASHGWIEEQAHAFAERLVAVGFTDAVVEQHPVRHRSISVRATRP